MGRFSCFCQDTLLYSICLGIRSPVSNLPMTHPHSKPPCSKLHPCAVSGLSIKPIMLMGLFTKSTLHTSEREPHASLLTVGLVLVKVVLVLVLYLNIRVVLARQTVVLYISRKLSLTLFLLCSQHARTHPTPHSTPMHTHHAPESLSSDKH